jgi:hypothetical protein
MNVECRRKEPFEILRFDILLFCGSLFRQGEVSYKEAEEREKDKGQRKKGE